MSTQSKANHPYGLMVEANSPAPGTSFSENPLRYRSVVSKSAANKT